MKLFKRICAITVNVLLWGLLVICALLMVMIAAVKASGGAPTIFGYGFYQIVTGSMEPEIMVGDVIIGKNATTEEIQIGDNIVFKYKGVLVTHKVIAIVGGNFITHGVANSTGSNEVVSPSDVVARQTAKLKGLGFALNFLRSPFGFILAVGLPIGGLVIYQTVILAKRLREYKSGGAEGGLESETMKKEIEELKTRLALTADETVTEKNSQDEIDEKNKK